jgi:large subunit ribosomal protein L24
MSKKIRRGDRVLVIAGNDQGKTGEVLSKNEDRVIVQGINLRKKHLPRTQQMQGGRIIEKEMSIHISNVAVCSKDGQKLRLRVKASKDGSRELVFQTGGSGGPNPTVSVYRPMKKPV